jgi:hypothetical protein
LGVLDVAPDAAPDVTSEAIDAKLGVVVAAVAVVDDSVRGADAAGGVAVTPAVSFGVDVAGIVVGMVVVRRGADNVAAAGGEVAVTCGTGAADGVGDGETGVADGVDVTD